MENQLLMDKLIKEFAICEHSLTIKKKDEFKDIDISKCKDHGTETYIKTLQLSLYKKDNDKPWIQKFHDVEITLCSECHEIITENINFFNKNTTTITFTGLALHKVY